MKTLPQFLTKIIAVFTILLALSFLLMPLNIMFYYGFHPSMIHSTSENNPFNLSITTIWIIHLTLGFLGGMGFGKKTFLLTGVMGLFCAAIITGFSFIYYSWRASLLSVEVIIPIIVGILPTMKLYDYLKERLEK